MDYKIRNYLKLMENKASWRCLCIFVKLHFGFYNAKTLDNSDYKIRKVSNTPEKSNFAIKNGKKKSSVRIV